MIKGINPRKVYNNCKYKCINISVPKYIKWILTDVKGEIDSNTIIVGDFNTSITSMARSSRQKINKKTVDLNDTLEQTDLMDIYRAFHLKAAEYTFFSSAHETFSRIDHMLGHKTNLSKFKKTEIISSIFSGYNTMRLEINYKKKLKNKNMWSPNDMLLNNQWITE